MLQRAASNACSWWWANHIRTKQTKWLEQSLSDMDEKVHGMKKLIEEEGDSFAKRAEMYYKRRPELIEAVDDTYKAFKALADRYDLVSKELQNANNTIATVIPEHVQFAMEDAEDDSSTPAPKHSRNFQNKSSTNIPKVPKASMDGLKGFINTASKKLSSSKSTKPKPKPRPPPKLTMSKEEALQEINKVNKEILALQTVKEFCKTSYENGLAKFLELERQIMEKQEKVSRLQDEYEVESVIEDSEARTLMAEAALKSCKETLSTLQEKQQQSNRETKDEFSRIEEAREMLKSLRQEHVDDNEKPVEENDENKSKRSAEERERDGDLSDLMKELNDIDTLTSEKGFDVSSKEALTVTQLAEKIDQLVNKVVNLETAVSSQTVIINTMRTEGDDLRARIRNLESEKESMMGDTRSMGNRIRELEDRLSRIEELNKNIEAHNNKLEATFNHACCSLDHLSESLSSIRPDEEGEEHKDVKSKKNKKDKKAGESNSHEKKSKDKIDVQTPPSNTSLEEIDQPSNLHKEIKDNKGVVSSSSEKEDKDKEIKDKEGAVSTSSEEEEKEKELKDKKGVISSSSEKEEKEIKDKKGIVSSSSEEEEKEEKKEIKDKKGVVSSSSEKEEKEKDIKDKKCVISSSSEKEEEKEKEIKDKKGIVSSSSEEEEKDRKDVSNSIRDEKDVSSVGDLKQVDASVRQASITKQDEVSKAVRRSVTFSGETTKERVSVPHTKDDAITQAKGAKEKESDVSWPQMLLEGAEDRDKILLREYTTILRNYKDVKRKLSETEKKDRDIQFDITLQMRQLKQAITKRDQEINNLRQELSILQGNKVTTYEKGVEQSAKRESLDQSSKHGTVDKSSAKQEPIDQSAIPEAEDQSTIPESETEGSEVFDDEEREEEIKLILRAKSPAVSAVEEKLRMEIDAILDENLDFWLRFSTAFHQVQKAKSEVEDLMDEISKLRNKKKQEGGMTPQLKSEVRPIYKHMREIQTELTVWLDQRTCLKDELKHRFTSLCSIQEEITKSLKEGVEEDQIRFSTHQAAKLQGEILNMKQENNKVREELQACLDHVSTLQLDIEKTLRQLNQEFSICTDQPQLQHSMSRSKVPLRAFIFGPKAKKQKSIFNFMHVNRKFHPVRAGY